MKADLYYLEKGDFERRMNIEKDLDKLWEDPSSLDYVAPSIGFDESDSFLYYGSMLGVKIISTKTW